MLPLLAIGALLLLMLFFASGNRRYPGKDPYQWMTPGQWFVALTVVVGAVVIALLSW